MPGKKTVKKRDSQSEDKGGTPATAAPALVVVGSSAGGLEALQEFLTHLPALDNTSFIVAQHLSPSHKSLLTQLLKGKTEMEVKEAVNQEQLKPSTVYITPPDHDISVRNNRIGLLKASSAIRPKPSVDVLLQEIAKSRANRVIAVILSGTGRDGAIGVESLKAAGGTIIAQDPGTASYSGMPEAAIQTGKVDAILPPYKMGKRIKDMLLQPEGPRGDADSEDSFAGSGIDTIIRLLSERTGTDFSHYKEGTLHRRLERRFSVLGVDSVEQYLEVLEEDPQEIEEMFKSILIGVTGFFRDSEAFDAFQKPLREMFEGKKGNEPFRVWIAGCSTGEEAYSITILLHEMLEASESKPDLQIFATDIDEHALAHARRAIFTEESVGNLSKKRRDRYFQKKGKSYELSKEIRSLVLFSRHDLTLNPPFLNLDVLSCRNLLIYFDTWLQSRVIPIFHYSLRNEGLLFLGQSETVGTPSDHFAAIDARHRVFRAKATERPTRVRLPAYSSPVKFLPDETPVRKPQEDSLSDAVKKTLYDTFEHPIVVVDTDGSIQEVKGDARLFLTLRDGRLRNNIFKMANDELQNEIRGVLGKAISGGKRIQGNIKRFRLFDKDHYVRITARPLQDSKETDTRFYLLIFEKLDIESYLPSAKDGGSGDDDSLRVRELEHELMTVRESLQNYIEEIESSNEELQSLNEEVQSTNEELQSSNEELETTNEELQSASEEMQIAYSELKSLNEELSRKESLLLEKEANLTALLRNDMQAFVLVDETYRILTFNEKARTLFEELISRKIVKGNTFIGLLESDYVEAFVRDFKAPLAGKAYSGEREMTDAEGRKRWFGMNFSPVVVEEGKVKGISIGIMEITRLKESLSRLNSSERLISCVFNATPAGICITDEDGNFVDVNSEYCRIFGYEREELLGRHFTIVLAGEDRPDMKVLHDVSVSGKNEPPTELQVVDKKGRELTVAVSAELLVQEDGKRYKITSVRDITEEKANQAHLNIVSKNLPVVIFRYMVDRRGCERLLYMSEGAKRLWGLDPSECLLDSNQLHDRVAREDRDAFRKSIKSSADKESQWRAEWRMTTADGSQRWHRGVGNPVKTESGEVIWDAVVIDIHESKEFEVELSNTLYKLGERVKEQSCLYRIASLNEFELSSRALLEKTVEYLPKAFRYPGMAEVAIKLGGKLTATKGYRHQKCVLKAVSRKGRWQSLEVRAAYRKTPEEKPPFLEEESLLLQAVANILAMKLEQLRFREALVASEGKYRDLFDNSPVAKLVVDRSSGRVVTLNRTAATLFGCKKSVATKEGPAVSKLVPSPVVEMAKSIQREAANSEREHFGQFDFSVKGKGEIVVEAHASRTDYQERPSLMVVCIDVTEQARTNRLLEKSEKRLQQAVHAARLGYWQLELDGTRIQWSDEVYRIFGRSPDSFKPDLEASVSAIHPADVPDFMPMQKAALAGTCDLDVEHRIVLPDKSIKWVHEKGSLKRDAEGNPVVFSGTVQDITERKRLEILFEETTQLARIGSWEINFKDPEHPTVYWSDMVRDLHGVDADYKPTLEDAIDFYAPESRDLVKAVVEASISTGDSFDFEAILLPIEKEPCWVRAIGDVERQSDGQPLRVFGSLQDIHDRKTAELGLRAAFEEKNTILESIGDAFFALNNDWVVTYWNKVAERLLGRIRDDVVSSHFLEVFPDAENQSFYSHYRRAMDSGKSVHFESIYEPSSKWFEVSAYPSDAGLSVYFKDITERKLAEEKLQESNERFEKAAAATNDAIWDWDLVEDSVYYAQGFQTLFGMDISGNVAGQHLWSERIHPDEREEILESLKTFLEETELQNNQSEYRFRRADGSYAHVMDRGVVIRNPDGKAVRMVGAMTDISYQKEHQEALKELNRNLEKQTRELAASNAELEQFAYVASHDLQEPLRMVSSFLTQLEKKYADSLDDRAHQYIDFAVDGAHRMRSIILDLLEFSRIGKYNEGGSELTMSELVGEVISLNRKLVDETDASVTCRGVETIYAYRSPVLQILRNLIGNSLKYRREEVAPEIVLSVEEDASSYRFSIRDNGIGISQKYHEKIFNIFQRLHTSDAYSGTGMGLAIVKKIVENLGGTISLDSVEGEGSTFYFSIEKPTQQIQ